jgi:Pyridine nucleotide-disulphide oxidoreductase
MKATGQRGQVPAGGGAARVVVAGAGFGGLAAVRGLARAGMRATLIDRNVYATFQPLLYEVATGGLTSSDVAYPARAVSRRHRAAFRHGELAGIDPAARRRFHRRRRHDRAYPAGRSRWPGGARPGGRSRGHRFRPGPGTRLRRPPRAPRYHAGVITWAVTAGVAGERARAPAPAAHRARRRASGGEPWTSPS